MKVAKIYAVRVQARNDWESKNSSEAYWTLENAQRFVESRSDNPVQITLYYYESSEYRYYIDELTMNYHTFRL